MVYSRIIIESKYNHGANLSLKFKAKELRHNMTETEKILWKKLRNKQQSGMHFRRQHPYGIYILDFYCFKANLAIEIDGKIHLGRKEYDEERSKYLESSGLKVLRFNNEDIDKRLDWVLNKIDKCLIDK